MSRIISTGMTKRPLATGYSVKITALYRCPVTDSLWQSVVPPGTRRR